MFFIIYNNNLKYYVKLLKIYSKYQVLQITLNKENKIQINTNPDINSNKKNEKKQNKLNIKIRLKNN